MISTLQNLTGEIMVQLLQAPETTAVLVVTVSTRLPPPSHSREDSSLRVPSGAVCTSCSSSPPLNVATPRMAPLRVAVAGVTACELDTRETRGTAEAVPSGAQSLYCGGSIAGSKVWKRRKGPLGCDATASHSNWLTKDRIDMPQMSSGGT